MRVGPDEQYNGDMGPSTMPFRARRMRPTACAAWAVVLILWLGLAWSFILALIIKYLP